MLREGDRVAYEPDVERVGEVIPGGTVLEVFEHKRYEYRVQWDDENPKEDVYSGDELRLCGGSN